MHPSTITEAGMDKLLAQVRDPPSGLAKDVCGYHRCLHRCCTFGFVQIDTMAKPVLVHCASAMRAGAMAVAYETVRRQLDLDDLESMAARTPFAGTSNTAFKRLVRDYAAGRLAMIESLPDIVDISDDLFVGPTITEADMRALAKGKYLLHSRVEPTFTCQCSLLRLEWHSWPHEDSHQPSLRGRSWVAWPRHAS